MTTGLVLVVMTLSKKTYLRTERNGWHRDRLPPSEFTLNMLTPSSHAMTAKRQHRETKGK